MHSEEARLSTSSEGSGHRRAAAVDGKEMRFPGHALQRVEPPVVETRTSPGGVDLPATEVDEVLADERMVGVCGGRRRCGRVA